MDYVILQYVLICLLVIAFGYFFYLLKDKENSLYEDYFGITHSILNSLKEDEREADNIKKILRIVARAVHYVENRYKQEANEIKEHMALVIAKENLKELHLNKKLDDDSIIYIIRLSAAMLLPTNEL